MSERRIDWDEVRRRVDASRRALDEALAPASADLDALWRERAELLARRRDEAASTTARLRLLVFLVRAEPCAVEFGDLAELLPYAGATPVPGGPAPLLGVVNVRGAIRSVVDLGLLLDRAAPAPDASGYLLLLRRGARQLVLRVDGIDRIRELAPQEITAPGAADSFLPFLRGLTPERVRLLDTDAIFAHPLFGGTAG